MLTSWSEVSTPAELSMKSVFTGLPARTDPGRLGQAQVSALGDDPGAQFGRIDPDRVGDRSPASACDWVLAFT
jgi:hypothetical protein